MEENINRTSATVIWNGWDAAITRRFGTHRGLVRMILANFLWCVGRYNRFSSIDWRRVGRIVFVCQGNICRSPFAEVVGKKLLPNLPITSVGLAADPGAPAFPLAQDAADRFDVDLSAHHSTDIKEFEIVDGDLLLVMEDRHLAQLRCHVKGRKVQIGLLGLWCRPRFPLLYDPHSLSGEYFVTCFDRIYRAVNRLAEDERRKGSDAYRPRMHSRLLRLRSRAGT
jgi:protein-tyrosine phosphatase